MYARKKLSFLCLLLLALIFSACGTAVSTVQKPTPTAQKPVPTATQSASSPAVVITPIVPLATPSASEPKRLLVPAIGVDASIENLGVLPNGEMATPTLNPWDDVGWYNRGTRPGDVGSAVIDGHLDRPGGAPAVFWDLRNLHAGDMVMIIDAHGATLRFQVTRVAAYAPNEAPLQDIFGNTGGKFLNLITCAGDWIPSQHQTTLRLVVYTKQI